MKGYMGTDTGSSPDEYDMSDDVDDDQIQSKEVPKPTGGYDLIYILDSIYHFPPAVPHFLTTAIQSLSPGGVIAYTDVIPPPNLPSWLGYWILPTSLGVPTRNLMNRPKDLAAYKAQLEKIGYVDVKTEDWTREVFPGFAKFMRLKGGPWTLVARGAEWAFRNEWKFIAVRAEKKR
jgi:SAM-dependent methyltransferase